jgi:hypothetical protein
MINPVEWHMRHEQLISLADPNASQFFFPTPKRSFDRRPSIRAARARLSAAAEKRNGAKTIRAEYYGGGRGDEEAVRDALCQGAWDGLLTRNHYGCLVLNAAHALFIDVDVLAPDQSAAPDLNGGWDSKWGSVFDDLRAVLAGEADESFRVYRTAAGFRVLATANEYDPTSPQSAELMQAAGADAEFVELCKIQNSFRARLSPKPWRCGLKRPPNLFPRHTEGEQRRYAEWLSSYERASVNRATCQYLGGIGPDRIHPRIAPVVELHDRQTKAHEALKLA